jgi:hypothetical protein
MSDDIDSLTPEAREFYRVIGERYPTEAVLAQADQILAGLVLYAAALAMHGFALSDGERVGSVRGRLLGKGDSIVQAKVDRKVLAKAVVTARRNAKAERATGTALLTGAEAQILETDPETASIVQTALSDTKVATTDKAVIDHLETMHEVLSLPALADFMATRGGTEVLERLEAARTALIVAKQNRSGKPVVNAAAERRNVLDGIIVSLARRANVAARAAARRLGQPAIAAAFKLDHLKSRRRRPAPVTEPAEPTEPTEPETPEVPGSPEDPDQNPA